MKVRIAITALATLSMLTAPVFAQDAAALYKSKCAMCHGEQGQGKPSGAPKIAGSARVETVLTKGGEVKPPHVKPMSTITADQVTSMAAYVKTLK